MDEHERRNLQEQLATLKVSLGEANPDIAWLEGEIAKAEEENDKKEGFLHVLHVCGAIERYYRLKKKGNNAYFDRIRTRLLTASTLVDQELFSRWLKDADISMEQLQRFGTEEDGVPYFKWRELMKQLGRSVLVHKEITWKDLGLEH